ncbi:MAG: LysM domain-containing protein [Aerococcaceae bacterium]|nr:LysM domain-containing protein [Aerococcaceae bacterium]
MNKIHKILLVATLAVALSMPTLVSQAKGNNTTLATEQQAALDKVTAKWTQRTAEQVKAEIQRQKDLKLDAYVIQWGDTLSTLACLTGQNVDDLAKLNGITNKDVILTGKTLKGILDKELVTATTSTNTSKGTVTSGKGDVAAPVSNTAVATTSPTTVENVGTATTTSDNGTVTAITETTTPAEENGAGTSTDDTTQPTDNGGATTEDTTTPPADNGGTDTTDGGTDTGGSTDDTTAPSIYRLGDIGNSGMEFATFEEADAWALAVYDEAVSMTADDTNFMVVNNFGGYYVAPIMWSDNVTFTYTVVFY